MSSANLEEEAAMRLDPMALALAGALFTGGALLFFGLLNLAFPGYAASALELFASIYPGYDGPGGIGAVLMGTLYGLVDGAIAGWLLAWLYNAAAGSGG